MRAALRAVFAFCFLLLLVGVARADPKLGLDLKSGPATSQGVRIERVEPGSPAAAEKIQPGDYIVEASQEAVTSAQDVADKVLRAYRQGKKSVLLLLARGEELRFVVLRFPPEPVAPAPPPTPAPVADGTVQRGQVGIRVQTVPPDMGRGKGAIIAQVFPGSPAAAEGLQPGDIVREVAQEPVTSADETASKIQREFAAGKKAVLLLLDRAGDLRFVALPFAEGPVTAPATRPAPVNPPVAVAPPKPQPASPPVQATPRPAPAPLPPVQEFDTAQGGAADAGMPPAQSLETGPSGSDDAALLQRLKERQARDLRAQAEEQQRQAEAEAQAEREAAAREAVREPFSLSRDIPASFGVIWEYVPKWVFLVAILIGAFLHQNLVLKVASGVFFFCQIALMGMSQFGFLETLLMPLRFWFIVPFQLLNGSLNTPVPGYMSATLYPVLSLIGYVAAIYYVGPDTRRYEWERLRGFVERGPLPFLKDWRERREIARERRALEQAERAAAWQQQPGYAGHPYPPPYPYPAPRTPLSEWFKTAYWAARLLILATVVIWLIWTTQEVLSMVLAFLPAPLRDVLADLLGRASEMARTPTTR